MLPNKVNSFSLRRIFLSSGLRKLLVYNQFQDTAEKIECIPTYEDIPGPKALPIVGNVFRYLPVIGEFANVPLMTQLEMLREKYGDIVRLGGIPNRRPTVFLFSPELCGKMYRLEGIWPQRIALESLQYYRENRHAIYKDEYGLSTSQGKKWQDFRSRVNPHMMQPRAVKPHVKQISEVTDELIGRIIELRDSNTLELPASFNNELNKWALESICSIALNHRLGCLKADLPEDSEPQTMINCVHDMFELMYQLEIRPSMWKLYETPNLKKLFQVLDRLNEIAIKHVERAKEAQMNKAEGSAEDRSVLEKLLRVDEQTGRVMSLDMLTAGVDTTGNASAALLYYLATNPEKQEKLREEAYMVLPDKDSSVEPETLDRIPYTKACIKESLRLFPISIGTMRTMQTEVTLAGYSIPKGCDVIACHALMSRDANQFPDPDGFVPERWLRKNRNSCPASDSHPFAYMPFGFGARTCVGRRFAEMEMEVLALKITRNFRIEWHREPLDYQSRLINIVSSPLQLKIIDL